MENTASQLKRLTIEVPHEEEAYASLYYLTVKPGVVVYRYDVEMSQDFFGNKKLLTKSYMDDGQKILYRRLCDGIMRVIREKYNFTKKIVNVTQKLPYVYDGRKNLYLLKPLDSVEEHFNVNKDELGDKCSVHLASDVKVKLQRSNNFELNLSDFRSSIQTSLYEQSDRSLRTFFELLTSQSFYNQDHFDVISNGLIYDRQVVQDNVYLCTQLKSGFKKGVRFIENDKKCVPALVIDVVSSVFYPPITIYDLCLAVEQNTNKHEDELLTMLSNFFKGVRGYLIHDPKRLVTFDGFSANSMDTMEIELKENGKISFVDFYAKKKCEIRDTRMRAVKVEGERATYYPPELFMILPFQRVPLHKTSGPISSTMINANSIKTFDRFEAINRRVRLMDDTFLDLFGVRVVKKNMITSSNLAKRLPLPNYKITSGLVKPDEVKGDYRLPYASKFIEGAIIQKWAILSKYINEIRNSVSRTVNEGRNLGMIINNPTLISLKDKISIETSLREIFQELSTKGYKFIVLCDRKVDQSHDIFKRLEVEFKILTQHITYDVFANVKPLTLKNILLKMNMKNGGMNYIPLYPTLDENSEKRLTLSNPNLMVFSYDVSHPAPATAIERNKLFNMNMRDVKSLEPSVVGFAANMAKNPFNFIGDYFYQASRKESVDESYIKKAFSYCLTKAKSNRPKFEPRAIIVIRDGVSEGEYQMAVTKELQNLREVGKTFYANMKFLFIVVNKRHGKRFFGIADNKRITNLNKCSAIDSIVVRPDVPEFFLMSHTPIRGTAKVPQYAVLQNDPGIPQKVIEEFLNVMCHSHQVSLGGVSIPASVYLAHELAKRGHNNYLCELRAKQIERDFLQISTADPKFSKLSDILSYRKTGELSNMRFTA